MNDAGYRRMDLDTVEQVARCNAAFDEFGLLALGFAKLFHDIGAKTRSARTICN